MRITLFLFTLIATISNCLAQSDKTYYNKSLDLSLGMYNHGTGDMKGPGFSVQYSKNFKKRLSWSIGIGATLHDGSVPITYSNNGEIVDGSIRYTTGGFQSNLNLGYAIIGNNNNKLELTIGPVLRYQTSSYYDEYAIYFPAATGLPFPVVAFNNTSPQRTFAFGGISEISYNYNFENNMLLGIKAGIQADTNDDILTNISLIFGIRLRNSK